MAGWEEVYKVCGEGGFLMGRGLGVVLEGEGHMGRGLGLCGKGDGLRG